MLGPSRERDMTDQHRSARSAFFTRSDSSTTFETPPSTQEITLLQLKITPETVFVSPRSLGGSNKQPSSSRRLSKRSSTRSNLQSRAFSSLNPLQHQLQRRTSTTAESLASVSLGAPSRPTSPIPLSTVPTFNPSSNLQPPHPSISPSISTTSLQSLSVTGGEGRSRSHLSRLPPKSSPSISAANTTVEGVFEKSLAMRLADDDERGSVSGRLTPGSSTLHREGSSPHLVSSSVFTGYDGTDPNLKAILENVYLETFRDPLPNFGPRILPSSVRRKQAARSPIVPSRPPNHLSQSHNSHLDATLISQLSEPSSSTITPSPIRFLAVSPDNVFFLTLSDAGTLKIWDTARLERSASAKARLVHEGKKRPTSFCLIEASHSFVIGWEDGTVEVWRVHLQMGGSAPKYRELELVTLFRLEEGEQEFVVALGHVVSGKDLPPSVDLRSRF
jgi:phosphoinositide-3-kinase regulatory subunit 4